MVRYENSDTLVAQFFDDLLNIVNSNGVDTGKRLVQQHEFGLCHERSCDLDTTTLAAGQLKTHTFSDMGNIQLVEQLVEALNAFFPFHR
ncbi:MAG: hypothetical protein HRT44_11270, partial [Bdellovibrionales bacterium]|nr:hypothetical protein [Bdellovibrionales bacterium]